MLKGHYHRETEQQQKEEKISFLELFVVVGLFR